MSSLEKNTVRNVDVKRELLNFFGMPGPFNNRIKIVCNDKPGKLCYTNFNKEDK